MRVRLPPRAFSIRIKILNITKELFVESLNKLKEQRDIDRKCSDAFATLLPDDYVTGYNNGKLYDQLIKLLEINTDGDRWVGYFVWECDFGDSPMEVTIDGKSFKLDTVDKLWSILHDEIPADLQSA